MSNIYRRAWADETPSLSFSLLLAAEQPLKLLCCNMPSDSAAVLLCAGCERSTRHTFRLVAAPFADLQHLIFTQMGKKPVHAFESLEATCTLS